jgi:hypothetical protein
MRKAKSKLFIGTGITSGVIGSIPAFSDPYEAFKGRTQLFGAKMENDLSGFSNGIADVKISRALKCAGKQAAAGHVWYVVSFKKHGSFIKASPQITLAHEEAVGVDAVKQYIRETYVK